MMRVVGLVAVAAAFALHSAPAAAATVTADWSGTITSGENLGVWSSVAADLTGQRFDLTFTYDLSLGSVARVDGVVIYAGGPSAQAIQGFTDCCASSPAVVTITVQGQSLTFDTDAFTAFIGTSGKLDKGVQYETIGEGLGGSALAFAFADGSPNLPTTFGVPYSGNPCTGAQQCEAEVFQSLGSVGMSAQLSIDHLTITRSDPSAGIWIPDPSLPEPSSWALMILGFGGIGTALRRRRPVDVLC